MPNFHVRAGQLIGLDHTQRQTNCQDSHALLAHDAGVIGIVCDGCSEGAHSEVGATLAARYLMQQAALLVQDNVAPESIPALLHQRLIMFLHEVVCLMHPADMVEFIRQHLLFTVVGVIASADGGVVFTAGDGIVAIDEKAVTIDQNNQPAYIAYHLIRERLPHTFKLPAGFDVLPLPADWQRVAIASDGFALDLLPDVWGIKHPRGLQRKLNVWGNQERRFRDDVTLIAIEKVETA